MLRLSKQFSLAVLILCIFAAHAFGTPSRIVSLVPSATEILAAIDASDKICGATWHDTTLKGADHWAVVGGYFSVQPARVKALDPDLVIAAPVHKEIIDTMAAAGIPVFVYDIKNLDQAFAVMEDLGALVDKKEAARNLARHNQDQLAHIQKKLASTPPKRTFRLMGRDRIMTPGNDLYQTEMIKAAGGIPPDFGIPGAIIDVSLEQWQKFNPQVIYGCGDDKIAARRFFSLPGWKDVDAVKNHQIYYIPCDLTCRASSRTGDFVAGLASNIHPEAFADPRTFVHPNGIVSKRSLEIPQDYVDTAEVVYSNIMDFENKSLVIQFKTPTKILSTLEGMKTGIIAVGNHYMPPPTWIPVHLYGFEKFNQAVLDTLELPKDKTAMLMTGADMDHLVVTTRSYKDITVTALITAGVTTNALRMGIDEGSWYEPGTINIILLTNAKLSERAMARAVISATEAKTAALQELDIRSSQSPTQATGTGTDNIVMVEGSGMPLDASGGHTRLGQLIANAVYKGVTQAVHKQNGLFKTRHIVSRLAERNISVHQVISGAQCGCTPGNKDEFSNAATRLLLSPKVGSFISSAMSVSDDYEAGLVADTAGMEIWARALVEELTGEKVDELPNMLADHEIPRVLKLALNAVMAAARIQAGGSL